MCGANRMYSLLSQTKYGAAQHTFDRPGLCGRQRRILSLRSVSLGSWDEMTKKLGPYPTPSPLKVIKYRQNALFRGGPKLAKYWKWKWLQPLLFILLVTLANNWPALARPKWSFVFCMKYPLGYNFLICFLYDFWLIFQHIFNCYFCCFLSWYFGYFWADLRLIFSTDIFRQFSGDL